MTSSFDQLKFPAEKLLSNSPLNQKYPDQFVANFSADWQAGLKELVQGNFAQAKAIWKAAIAKIQPELLETYQHQFGQFLAIAAQKYFAEGNLEAVVKIRRYFYQIQPENVVNLLEIVLLSVQLNVLATDGKQALLKAALILSQNPANPDIQPLILQILQLLVSVPFERYFLDFLAACLGSFRLNDPQVEEVNLLKSQLLDQATRRGIHFCQQGQFTAGIELFRQILALEQYSAEKFYNLGTALYYQGLLNGSLDHLEEAEKVLIKTLQIDAEFNRADEILESIPFAKNSVQKGYKITADCFTGVSPIWEQSLKQFRNFPEIQALEIGSWEGISACWLLDHILTHDTAQLTCIDTFEGVQESKKNDLEYRTATEQRFDFNIAQTGNAHKVKKLRGKSQEVLRSLPLNSYHFIYIDGSHFASDVLEDAILCWRLLKVEGLLIFDDYNYEFPNHPHQNTGIAIDAFLKVFQEKLKIVYQGSRQVIVEKIAG